MISTADLQDWMKADDADAPTLRILEEAAVAAAQKETGHYYGVEAQQVEVIRFQGFPLALKNEPAGGAITSLESWDGTAWSTVDATSYYVWGSFIFAEGSWNPLSLTRFRATYDAGGTVNPLDADEWTADADVKQAIRLAVANWFENRESVVVGTTGYELPQSAKDLLHNNRRVTV